MIKATYTTTDKTHIEIIEFIKKKKEKNPSYRVIDLGGGLNGWSADIANLIVDINVPDSPSTLQMDICDESNYKKIVNFVEANGLFDYCICTHTLEDLYNPFLPLKYMPRIAHAGVITMPTITDELSPVQSLSWNGYIHHRWMFDFLDGKIFIIPKIKSLEAFLGVKMSRIKGTEIKFEWERNIPYDVFMQNYLGPDLKTVASELNKVVQRLNAQARGVYFFRNRHTRSARILMRLVRFVRMKVGIKL